ncbi:MAG TPA: enolase C-terminal domain-like protein [Microlunatus sp.]
MTITAAKSDQIIGLRTRDVRFPTSSTLDGSDAMNPDPDYSAAYVVVETVSGLQGHGFTFTIGRGNDVQLAAIDALSDHLVGRDLDRTLADLGGIYRELVSDSQLRWLGPEKGIMHMAIGAVMNALWDLRAKRDGLPLWRLLATLPSEEIVDMIDFRYLTDALTPAEALQILRRREAGALERIEELEANGYPAYTTTPGWLGYSDEKLARLTREAVADGFGMIKLKVGADIDDDLRRLAVARGAAGPDIPIAVDANQRWDVPQAIEQIRRLGEPYWVEEPTSPDDILGHAAIRAAVRPVKIATGEHAHNRIMVKQLLQAGSLDVLQLDAARVAGVNENLAILLLATKFDTPVCPHAGGVGLCELVQHLAMFDFVRVSGTMSGRVIEYVDHLHEHFVDPVRVSGGRYRAPVVPGNSAELTTQALNHYQYPDGPAWRLKP